MTNGCSRRGKKHYDKINIMTKKQFIAKVLGDNVTIKEASKIFKINYSTAKTIIRLHKIKNGHCGEIWDHVLSKPCLDSETDAHGGMTKQALFRDVHIQKTPKKDRIFRLCPYTSLIVSFQKPSTQSKLSIISTINGLSS